MKPEPGPFLFHCSKHRTDYNLACEGCALERGSTGGLTAHAAYPPGTPPPVSNIKASNPKDAVGAMKAKLSVIPSGVMFALGNAMLEGMCKYGRHNYRGVGVRASIYYDAAMGHLMDWWEGQDIDPESGELHLVKAMASLAVAIDAIQQGMMHDDRPPRSKVFKVDFSGNAAAIIERHKDKAPRHWTIADTPAPLSTPGSM